MLLDKDIREPLFAFLEEEYGRIRILEEKVMGRSRADLIMITETDLIGIEIKSDADSYTRLARQVKDYDKYFDANYVVVGASHGLHIKEHVPDHWGIITVEEVDGKADFYRLRQAKPNPKMSWEKKIRLMWRPELAKIQEEFAMPKYRERSKEFVCAKILERLAAGKIDETKLKACISRLLFERDYTTVEEMLAAYKENEAKRKRERVVAPEKQLAMMMARAARPRRRRRK